MKIIYQYGTLGMLMEGLLEGTKPLAEILAHGNFGIGTLDSLDGEMTILDGIAYQGKSDGRLVRLTGKETIPYGAITDFTSNTVLSFSEEKNFSEIKASLEEHIRSKNLFAAVKIQGHFKQMSIRIMPKQTPPYKHLVDIAQPEFKKKEIDGTIVGLYTPSLFQGVAMGGFHLHFIDDACTFTGHIIDCVIESGVGEISDATSLAVQLPETSDFLAADLDYTNLEKEIEQAE
ncbi:acetolactate decarboxylase [uncultured Enterococcus sp.]|uniref:acetolactate decarboxylase n=1 Tax=uncultured Enterococcus sp. TaxID=167972 RepID=UPI00374876EF